MKNKLISGIYGFLFLALSIVLTVLFMKARYSESEQTLIVKAIYEITKGYRMYQILASLGMYLVGFAVAYPLCVKQGAYLPFLSAMPVGNALWGIISSFMLFLNVPYNRITVLAVVAVILLFLFRRYKEIYKNVDVIKTINMMMLVLAFIIMASSGMLPKNYSFDSFYYVMQYGELIARTGRLSSDIVGTYMTWVGITPALTSAYAAMFGFETIYAIHHLLVFSMYGFAAYCVYQGTVRFFTKGIAVICAFFTLYSILFTPIVNELAVWIISNTYFMVYLVFFIMLPVIARDKMDMGIALLMSLYAMWMTLCRIEAAPYMCFLIVCITCLDIPEKQSRRMFLAVFIVEALYLLKILTEYLSGAKQAYEQELTMNTAAVILIVFFLTGIYFMLYHFRFIKFIRKYMSIFGIAGLLIGCVVLGLFDWERFVNNVTVALTNVISNWYWPLPVAILACEILKTCFKCRNKYFDLIIWGSVLFYFALCMGRLNNLRLGAGDSYHRICISIVPSYIVSTIYTFINYLGNQKHLVKTMGSIQNNEINHSDSLL